VNLAALLDEWAAKYDVKTVIERVLGGDTVPVCPSLVAHGKTAVVVVDDEAGATRARAAYGPNADVRLAGRGDEDLPKSDMVVIHGTPAGDWREVLLGLGKHAAKLVVVAAENPGAWRAEVRARWTKMTEGTNGDGHGDARWGRTEALAPVLWEIGRVREHAFLDVPPLGVRAPKLARRVAPFHAFVVDVTPRSPQARRRLRLETT
jgi:hypothetical protein